VSLHFIIQYSATWFE